MACLVRQRELPHHSREPQGPSRLQSEALACACQVARPQSGGEVLELGPEAIARQGLCRSEGRSTSPRQDGLQAALTCCIAFAEGTEGGKGNCEKFSQDMRRGEQQRMGQVHEGRKAAVHKIMNLVVECLVLPRSKQPAVIHKRVMQGETTPENPHRQDKSSYHFEKPLSPIDS